MYLPTFLSFEILGNFALHGTQYIGIPVVIDIGRAHQQHDLAHKAFVFQMKRLIRIGNNFSFLLAIHDTHAPQFGVLSHVTVVVRQTLVDGDQIVQIILRGTKETGSGGTTRSRRRAVLVVVVVAIVHHAVVGGVFFFRVFRTWFRSGAGNKFTHCKTTGATRAGIQRSGTRG
jgi:hypothetical protein